MLYISTRNHVDSFTAHRTLYEDFAPDGGMFVPMRFPIFTEEDLIRFKASSFGETVASVLNLFFSADLTGWHIDACAGRYPCKLIHMSRKMIISELWHNQKYDYCYLESGIYHMLCDGMNHRSTPTSWAKIAIRMSVLCGVWGMIMASESETFDVAVSAEDFIDPVAVIYLKKMGLPMGTLLFACQNDSFLWDLFYHGELNTSQIQSCFSMGVERLIFDKFGLAETTAFLNTLAQKRTYLLEEERASCLSAGIYASVIGSRRIDSLTSSIFRSCSYIAEPSTALCFGALQNYRAQTGSSQTTLLLAYHNPELDGDRFCQLLGISKEALKKHVKNI